MARNNKKSSKKKSQNAQANQNPANSAGAGKSKSMLPVALIATAIAGFAVVGYIVMSKSPGKTAQPQKPGQTAQSQQDRSRRALEDANEIIQTKGSPAAEAFLQSYLKQYPNDTNVRLGLVNFYMGYIERALSDISNADYKKTAKQAAQLALENIKIVYLTKPGNPEATFYKGYIAEYLKPGSGSGLMIEAAESPNVTSSVLLKYGRYLMTKGDYEVARYYLEKSYEKGGATDARLAAALGEYYLSQNKFAKAEKLLKQAQRAFPKRADIMINLADLQYNQRRYADALTSLLKARRYANGPQRAGLFKLLGNVYNSTGNLKEAAESYQEAATYSFQKAEMSYKAARCYLRMSNYRKAMQMIDDACEIDPASESYAKLRKRIEDRRFVKKVDNSNDAAGKGDSLWDLNPLGDKKKKTAPTSDENPLFPMPGMDTKLPGKKNK